MARNYPRFSFSNPINSKSPGPFIIHNLKPRGIFKVNYFPFNKVVLEPLDFDGSNEELITIKAEALKWFEFQPERLK